MARPENKVTKIFAPQVRLLIPTDTFFEDGDIYCNLHSKFMLTGCAQEQGLHNHRLSEFQCHVAGCHLPCSTLADYESHYNSVHRNVCRVCHRVLPSNHLLEIHVLEWHDTLFDVLAAKHPMYLCLVQDCHQKFASQDARKAHLVACHQYPRNFRFDKQIKIRGVKSLDCGDDVMEVGIEESEGRGETRSAPGRRVPSQISFGRGRPRTFQTGHKGTSQKNRGDRLPMDES